MSEKQKYKTTYKSLKFYSLGGYWGFAIMIIKDSNDDLKIRLAKCKKQNSFPATEKRSWEDVDPSQIDNLSQVNKINFKTKEEFEDCYEEVLSLFEEIDGEVEETI